MKKNILIIMGLLIMATTLSAQIVNVKLKPDAFYSNREVVSVMERNLSMLLTEINAAQRNSRPLNLFDIPMNDFAKNGLRMLWANVYFYCDDEYVVDRLWNFKDGFMARSIPIIITPEGEEYGSGVFSGSSR